MKSLKCVLSLFMVFMIVLISIVPTFALDNIYAMYKLDDELLSKLDEIGNNEKVTVSIWFNDVDYSITYSVY